jgi:hypothetical protein
MVHVSYVRTRLQAELASFCLVDGCNVCVWCFQEEIKREWFCLGFGRVYIGIETSSPFPFLFRGAAAKVKVKVLCVQPREFLYYNT